MRNASQAGKNSQSLTMALSATDLAAAVAQMRFSNNDTHWSDWEAYATSANWMLHPGDGLRTVFAQYRDELGNVSTDEISDDITCQILPEEKAGTDEHWWLYR